jgi:hypothetical protein
MKKLTFLLIALAAWGCASAPPPATPQTFANYNTQANHDKQISLEGYLRLPVSALVNDTMLLDLKETPDSKDKPVSVSLYIGAGANQVEKPPKDYTDKDLKVHANDGSLIEPNQKVRVSAKLIYNPSASILYKPVDIQKI